jgi:hypothetical protein
MDENETGPNEAEEPFRTPEAAAAFLIHALVVQGAEDVALPTAETAILLGLDPEALLEAYGVVIYPEDAVSEALFAENEDGSMARHPMVTVMEDYADWAAQYDKRQAQDDE